MPLPLEHPSRRPWGPSSGSDPPGQTQGSLAELSHSCDCPSDVLPPLEHVCVCVCACLVADLHENACVPASAPSSMVLVCDRCWPAQREEFFGHDYPDDEHPTPQKGHDTLPLQEDDVYDKDYVKDENNQTEAWHREAEYEFLMKKVASARAGANDAEKKEEIMLLARPSAEFAEARSCPNADMRP